MLVGIVGGLAMLPLLTPFHLASCYISICYNLLIVSYSSEDRTRGFYMRCCDIPPDPLTTDTDIITAHGVGLWKLSHYACLLYLFLLQLQG